MELKEKMRRMERQSYQNFVQNQEAFDYSYSAKQGEINSAAHKVGTKVFLKSLTKHNMDVALATIMSCDPKFKLDGAKIGNEFWAVHVDMTLVKTENLVRSRKECNTLD
ncbi:hypothetical protein D1007_03128 [Hordeum vulgare]|nr:hypothetical protein D1007_03128 [Hordeum vulgare]